MNYLDLIPRPQEVTVSEDIWFETHRSICIKNHSAFNELIPLITQELLSMELTVHDEPAETTIHFIQDATVSHQDFRHYRRLCGLHRRKKVLTLSKPDCRNIKNGCAF